MARVLAGIGVSHVPSIGVAYDRHRGSEPAWKPLFDALAQVKAWLAEEVRPEVAIVVYNDHGNDFFFDRYPTFALGVAESYGICDEGWGARSLPPVPGHADLSWHVATSLVKDEFDLTICQEMEVDHGLLAPLPLLWAHDPAWDVRVVPLEVNVLQHPLPTGRRCFNLGKALRRAIESYPEDLGVVVVGTGGLSHQLNGERFGYLSSEFDEEWLDRIAIDPEGLAELDHEEIMKRAGAEGVEVIMWLIMRGALAPSVSQVHRFYYAPMTTGIGMTSLVDA